VRIEELEVVCQEAARNVVSRHERPIPATVVLPLPAKTRVAVLPDWPDDDAARFDLLSRFAEDVMRSENAPCYGFLAEGIVEGDDGTLIDVVVVVFGARRNHPRITAAALTDDGLGEFAEADPLAPGAMPFLAPLQHAVDAATPPDAFGPALSG
jgi:hypothetical protein